MDRSRLRELHYITDIANVASILDHGLLSHRLVERRIGAHVTVASGEVQARRARKRIPMGRSSRALHDYVNLYVHARNAMQYTLLEQGLGDLTVLAVDAAVLDLAGVIVADRNAASAARFRPAEEGIDRLDETAVLATWWNQSDDARQRRMAEVLVPDRVDPGFLRGAHVPDPQAAQRLLDRCGERQLAIRVNRHLFFNRSCR
jgi:hypothetical protein